MTETGSQAATLDILQKYSQLLNDKPESRSVLAQDANLAALLSGILITSEDQKIIRMTLEIMLELISDSGGVAKDVLSSTSGFKTTLIGLKEKFKSDVNVGFICDSMLDALFPEFRVPARSEVTSSNTNTTSRTRIARFIHGSTRQSKKTLIFQSETFSDPDVKRAVETALVKIKGVVSIYFESSSTSKIWRCILRVSTTIMPETVADSILATGCLNIVQHVSKNEFGDEVLISYGQEETEKKIRLPDKSSPLPAYLDENDDMIFGVIIGDRAMTKYGEKESNKSGGWLSGVSAFFSKTLYW